jgi:hypothetical protein
MQQEERKGEGRARVARTLERSTGKRGIMSGGGNALHTAQYGETRWLDEEEMGKRGR